MVKKKRSSRRGAIELSITTIIVIVIGVVLLGLGIAFVSGIIGDAQSLTKQVFQGAQASISKIDIGGKFSVPSSVEVEDGGESTVDIVIGHDGSLPGKQTFRVELTQKQGQASGVTATLLSDSTIDLEPGQQATFRAIVEAPPGSLAKITSGDTPAFSVKIFAGSEVYENSGFIVKVTKGTSLFG